MPNPFDAVCCLFFIPCLGIFLGLSISRGRSEQQEKTSEVFQDFKETHLLYMGYLVIQDDERLRKSLYAPKQVEIEASSLME